MENKEEKILEKTIISRKFERETDIRSGKIDKTERTVDISFSSEKPVKRYFGNEILDHSHAESANLDRLNDGGAVLVDHAGDQVGVVQKAYIDSFQKRGFARLKFSQSQRGQEIFQDILDGIRKNISFAYTIDAFKDETQEDDEMESYRITRWTPLEISIVGIPADETVGIGRSLEIIDEKPIEESKDAEVETEVETETVKSEEAGVSEDEKQVEPVITEEVEAEVKTENVVEIKEGKDEKKRVSEIMAIAEKHPNLRKEAENAIANKISLEDFQKTTLERIFKMENNEIKPVANVELSAKEEKTYSIMNGIRSLMTGKNSFEKEVSQEIAKRIGKDPQGFYLRDLNVTTSAQGGYAVATDLLAGSFIDLLRNKSSVMAAGATMLTGLRGDIQIPKQTGAATAYWVSEGNAPTESTPALGQISLSPSTVGAFTDYTRKFMLQSSVDAENFVRNDLAQVLALEIDRAALNGSGSGAEPTGLLQSAISTVALGTNGAAPTFAKIVRMKSVVDASNALMGNLKFITNASAFGTLQTTEKASSTAQFIAGEANSLIGYPVIISEQVPSNLTKNSGTSLSAIVFGNFADLIVGMWGALDITVDPYALATAGGIRVIALQDIDIAIRNLTSFSKIVDMVTAS